MKTFYVGGDFQSTAFTLLTSFRKQIEFPRVCHAELTPVFTYKAEELRDEN